MEHRLFSTKEAALLLGVSPQTLRLWRCRGGGPRYHRFGKTLKGKCYYSAEAVQTWLACRSYQNTSEETVNRGGDR